MADDYYFGKRNNRHNQPYDYDEDMQFEDIYSDSRKDPDYIPLDTPQYRQRNTQQNYDQYEDIYTKKRSTRPSYASTPSTPKQRATVRSTRPDNYDYYDEQPRKRRQSQNQRPVKNKKKRGCGSYSLGTVIIALLLVFVFLYLAVTKLVFSKMNYDASQHQSNSYISNSSLKSSAWVENILLLGVDAREGETVSRSDTMMLVSIDKKHNKIKLTSFLRDSYVEIPGHGWNKLNAACSYGGIQLVIDTLEYNYKVEIDKYLEVNFEAFTELIDALGGVDVEVTETEASYLNRTWSKWSLTGNELHFDYGDSVHLDGEQALMFCRIRKLDSDFMRTDRQRRVISALKSQITDIKASEVNGILSDVMPNITTDLHDYQVTNLSIMALLFYRNYDIEQMSLPYTGTWHDETISGVGDALVFDLDENVNILQNFIYYDQSPDDSTSEDA